MICGSMEAEKISMCRGRGSYPASACKAECANATFNKLVITGVTGSAIYPRNRKSRTISLTLPHRLLLTNRMNPMNPSLPMSRATRSHLTRWKTCC